MVDLIKLTNMTESCLERFWSYINVGEPDECWPWLAGNSVGYGWFFVEKGFQIGAHRVMAFLVYGLPDPLDLYTLHTCDNRICCNPSHLFYGTHDDNMLDCGSKGRLALQVHPELTRGSRNGKAKLTEEAVREIRASNLKGVELAAIYNVSGGLISAVQKNRTWRHI